MQKKIFISYPWLIEDAKAGDRVLLDDGLLQLEVIKKTKNSLAAQVVEGGILKEHKGVNLPHMKISAPSFTEKDKNDLDFGIKMDVDYVALSFVRTSNDIKVVKKWFSRKGTHIPLIAKIEKEEAIDNIDDILNEVDGIMVARGDLGVEMPLEEVPMFQKMLIKKANERNCIVITATQMLESMTQHSRPTRAETTDVANAILDGTDALMLSAETSAGKFPIEAVKVMNKIIAYTEEKNKEHKRMYMPATAQGGFYEFPEATAHAASRAAQEVGAKWIVVFTKSGFTAKLISKFKPEIPIIALSPDERVVRRMSIYWGVFPYMIKQLNNEDELVKELDSKLIELGYAKAGDNIIIVASLPLSLSGKTNFMKIHKIRKSDIFY